MLAHMLVSRNLLLLHAKTRPLISGPASRGCLDLLNDSISDMSVSDKERLVDWLHQHSNQRKWSGILKRSSAI